MPSWVRACMRIPKQRSVIGTKEGFDVICKQDDDDTLAAPVLAGGGRQRGGLHDLALRPLLPSHTASWHAVGAYVPMCHVVPAHH